MVKSIKTTASRKHEDRELAAKAAFESTLVEVQTPQTMIVLLASKEVHVILKALSTLDKYASKLEQNAMALHDEGVLTILLPLITHSEQYIQRFAIKLLSELCFLSSVVNALIEEGILPSIIDIMNTTSDVVVQEFSASIVAELTRTRVGCDQFKRLSAVQTLFPHLSVADPDIQKNALQIIHNIIQDPYEHSILTNEPEFTTKTFIELMMSDYLAIQYLSLDILNILTQRRKGNAVSKDFQESGGITKMLTILKNYEWKDLHSKCLDVLGNAYDDPDLAQQFLKDGAMQLFHYMDFINDVFLRKRAVEVIAKIAGTSLGRKVLADSGLVPRLVSMLSEQSVGVAAAVSGCVSGLAQQHEALLQLVEQETVPQLLALIVDRSRGWTTRGAASAALYQVIKRDHRSCNLVVESDKKDVFESILSEFDEEMPINVAITTTNNITVLAGDVEMKQKMISKDLISALIHCFKECEEDSVPLKVAACEALCALLSEPEARHWLKVLDALPVVWGSVTKRPLNTALLQTAATLIHVSVSGDPGLAQTLLRLDVLNWLLSQRSLRHECPAWEVALETVFNKFLPIKFAFTGRLELTDVTENNFYITKEPLSREELDDNQFPMFNDFIQRNSCPIKTVYFANFEDLIVKGKEILQSDRERKVSSLKGKDSVSKGSSVTSTATLLSKSKSCTADKFSLADDYLQAYIKDLKMELREKGLSIQDPKSIESVVDGDTIRAKAVVIGQFVARQMAGVDRTEACNIHSLQPHVNELKVEIQNSLIPVGWLRVGLHLERAFLFKVLADRVGLPCALVRGSHPRRAWVEVALPRLPPTPRPAHPAHLLRPDHLVDLMDHPGTLLALNTYQADAYCGLV